MRGIQRCGLWRILWTVTTLVVATSLGVRAQEPKVDAPVYNTISDAQEVAFGREAAAEIEKEQKLSIIESPRIHDYVNRLVQRIAAQSRRPQLTYVVKVVNTSEINAFALPGGFVYVNRGLIEWSRNESELVGAVGHEIGHVVGRHGANKLSRYVTLDSIVLEASRVLLGDETPALVLKQIGGPVAFLALMKYSRTDELQADLLSYYNIQRAGWSPDGLVDLFKHFAEGGSPLDQLTAILNSHPAPVDREAQIVDEMKKAPPKSGLAHDSQEFKSIQAELKQMPKPPKANAGA